MESWEDYMKRLYDDMFDTLVYVADSMQKMEEVRNKVDKMVDEMSKLPIKR